MDPSILEALSMLSDEELAQAFNPYEQQLAMAEALRKPNNQQHTTGWGAALAGLGNAIGGTVGAYKQGKVLDSMQADMLARAQALRAQKSNPAAANSAMGATSAQADLVRALLGQQKPAEPMPWAGVPYPVY